MLMDITLPVSQEMLGTAWGNTNPSLVGHLGTHFDGMDKEFPLEYNRREGIVFDEDAISGSWVIYKDMRHRSDELAVLNDGTAGHADVK